MIGMPELEQLARQSVLSTLDPFRRIDGAVFTILTPELSLAAAVDQQRAIGKGPCLHAVEQFAGTRLATLWYVSCQYVPIGERQLHACTVMGAPGILLH